MTWNYSLNEIANMLKLPPPEDTVSCQGLSTDTRTLHPGQLFCALSGDQFNGNRFVAQAFEKGASAAIVSEPQPDAPGPCLLVEDTQDALQHFAAAHRARFDIPLIAITGSCGKTTAKDFTAALLSTRYTVVKTQGNLNNEIGCPISLLQLDNDTDIALIEMGANHKGEIANLCTLAKPTESAITMVAPAHLEGFGTEADVAKAKAEIMEGLSPTGRFYINLDNAWCRAIGEEFDGEKITFGHEGDIAIRACAYDDAGELYLTIDPIGDLRLPLPIKAQAINVALAVAIALQHGITEFEAPLRAACKNAARFRILSVGGLQVLEDCYNASPASVKAALEALKDRPGGGKRFAALGDMLELGDASRRLHEAVGEQAAALELNGLFAYGPNAAHMAAAARAAGLALAESFDSHERLAEAVRSHVAPDDTLLVKGSRGMRMEAVIEALK